MMLWWIAFFLVLLFLILLSIPVCLRVERGDGGIMLTIRYAFISWNPRRGESKSTAKKGKKMAKKTTAAEKAKSAPSGIAHKLHSIYNDREFVIGIIKWLILNVKRLLGELRIKTKDASLIVATPDPFYTGLCAAVIHSVPVSLPLRLGTDFTQDKPDFTGAAEISLSPAQFLYRVGWAAITVPNKKKIWQIIKSRKRRK